MLNRFTALILLLSIILCSCGTHTANEPTSKSVDSKHDDYIKIDIEKPVNEFAKLDDLIESIAVIELMNNDSCYIIDIDRIEEYKNEYFVLDKQQSSLFVFNKEGKFLRKIGERGIGPEMYREITSFSLDKKREIIIIHCNDDMSLIEYNLNGEFNKRSKLDFFAFQMRLLNSNTLGFYSGLNLSVNNHLILTDLNGIIKSNHFPYPETRIEMGYGNIGGLSKSMDRILFNEVGSSYLYSISDSVIKAVYHVYLGKLTWPEDKKDELSEFTKKMTRFELAYLFNTFIENSQALIFEYLIGKKFSKAIYLRASNSLYTEDNIEDNSLYRLFKLASIPIGFNEDGSFISSLTSNYTYQFREKHPTQYQELSDKHPEIYQNLEKVNENSNPILLIYDFK